MPSHNILLDIDLNASDLANLQKQLDSHIDMATQFRASWEVDHETYINSYFTRPDQDEKNDPWPGASNTYLPLIRVGIDGLQAQFYDTLLSQLPFITVQGLNDEARARAEDLSFYYGEFYLTKQVNFRQYGGNFLFDLLTDGTAVGKGIVDRSETLRRSLREVQRPKRGRPSRQSILPTLFGSILPGQRQTVSGVEEEVFIEETRAIRLFNTDLGQIHVPPYTGTSLQWPECPWYYEKHDLTWLELLARKRQGYNVGDHLKAHLGIREPSPTEDTKAEQVSTSLTDAEPTIEMLEFYMRLVLPNEIRHARRANKIEKLKGVEKQKFMDEEGWEEEVVVTYLPKAKEIIRIVPLDRVRSDGKRPHIDGRYHRIPNSFYGSGVPESRMGLQRAVNSFFNQMVDYGTLQNLPWAFFQPHIVGDLPERMFLEPGALIPTNDPGGVNFPRFQGDASFWISAIQMIQAWFERAESVSDFTRGISPDRPNAPETARATLALISNAQLAFDWKSAEIAEYLTEAVRHVHSLHQQYLGDDVTFDFFNRQTDSYERRDIPKAVFKEPVEFKFVLNPSRSSEQQTNQLLFTMLAEPIMIANNGDPNSLRPIAKDLWTSHGKDNFDEVWPELLPPQIGQGQPGGASTVDGSAGVQPGVNGGGDLPPDFNTQLSGSLDDLAVPQSGTVLSGEEEGVKLPKPSANMAPADKED